MGIAQSKNNCHIMVGDQIVYDETYARSKEREEHKKRLNELHTNINDDLSLNYITVQNTQVNVHGNKSIPYSILELVEEEPEILRLQRLRLRSHLNRNTLITRTSGAK